MTIGLETMPVGVAGNTYTHLRQAIDRNFAKIELSDVDIYSIGTPGNFGFGVSACRHIRLFPGEGRNHGIHRPGRNQDD